MHRHAYRGRKLSLEAGQRRALIRGQVTSLVLHESITTTLAKAKEVAPHFERLVTKAKKADLHNRRMIRAFLLTDKATDKLIAEIAPTYAQRHGGYTRIVKAGNRRGDNAQLAILQIVKDPAVSVAAPAEKTTAKADAPAVKKPAARKPAAKKTAAKEAK